ncbi:MAG: YfhO family protein, partial [Lachnospiraceae bacterium]|nr:YfhO family protein [Lachnospiraceae bacterium]
AFAVTLQMHIMWLDALYILPLLILFLLRFVREGKGLPLCLCYAYLFFTNFYTGYIVGIFSFLCFIALLYINMEDFSKEAWLRSLGKLGRYVLWVLLAAGLCAVILLPAAAQLIGQRDGDPVGFRDLQASLPDVAANLFLGQMQGISSPVPLLYCGLPVLFLLPLYFRSRLFDRKEKLAAGLILGFYLLGSQVPVLYRFLHAFEAPSWFDHRYSFCIVFLLLVLAARALPEWEEADLRKLSLYTTGLLLFYSLMIPLQKLTLSNASSSQGWLILNAAFLLAYLLLAFLRQKGLFLRFLPAALCILLSAELFIGGLNDIRRNSWSYVSEEEYTKAESGESALIRPMLKADTSLYRIRVWNEGNCNASAAFHYPGLNSFSSVDPAALRSVLASLGIAAPFECIYDIGYTPLTSMLFGVRYEIALSDDPAASPQVIGNPAALPVAFMADASLLEYSPTGDAFLNQQNLLNALSGKEHSFYQALEADQISFSGKNMKLYSFGDTAVLQHESDLIGNAVADYRFSVSADTPVYAYLSSTSAPEMLQRSPIVLGQASPFLANHSFSLNTIHIAALQEDESLPGLRISFQNGGDMDLSIPYSSFVQYDPAELPAVWQELNESPLSISEWHDGYICGTVSVTEDKPILFTTIPYDKGWKLSVDGSPFPLGATVNSSFLSTVLMPGTHEVELRYVAPLSGPGKLISVVCAILLLLLYLKGRKASEKPAKKKEPTADEEA